MRAFFSINLPNGVKEELFTIEQELKKFLPSLNWVAKDNLHLTVKFLGDIRGEELDALMEIAKNYLKNFHKFDVIMKDINIFPATNPRIIYTKLVSNELQQFIEKFITEIDALEFVDTEKRAFLPHITLGRVKDGLNKYHINKIQNISYQNNFTIDSLELVQSKLRPSGPVYSIIKSFSLQ